MIRIRTMLDIPASKIGIISLAIEHDETATRLDIDNFLDRYAPDFVAMYETTYRVCFCNLYLTKLELK